MSVLIALTLAFLAVAIGLALHSSRARCESRRTGPRRDRTRAEDVLKRMLSEEHAGRATPLDQLAWFLRLGPGAARNALAGLQAEGLIEGDALGYRLTSRGRDAAVKVLRAHRVWERFLADEARMRLEHLHGEAERREHHLSERAVADLEAHLGYPAHDPHGDPIPDAKGRIPGNGGTALTRLAPGTTGRVTHIEDEPPATFARILVTGLRPGQELRVLESSAEGVMVSDGVHQHRFAPDAAAAIFLAPSTRVGPLQPAAPTLAALAVGQHGEVVSIDESCQGLTRRRLLDLGFTPGAAVKVEMSGVFRDPRAYRVRDTLIALREEDARRVRAQPIDERPATR